MGKGAPKLALTLNQSTRSIVANCTASKFHLGLETPEHMAETDRI